MEPARRVQQDIRCAGCQGWEAGSVDDRCDPSEGPSDGSQLAQKGDVPRRIGRTKGGMNSKLHAVCAGHDRPLLMLLSEGRMCDSKGAAPMLSEERRVVTGCVSQCRDQVQYNRQQHTYKSSSQPIPY